MITNENYEGYLMRYADGELSAAEATEVETFLDEHPELREELEEITAPSLCVTAPVATMPDKERLLHKETSIVSILRYKKWMSIAAAIALLVVAAGVVRTLLQQSHRQPVIAHIDTAKTMAADTLLPDSLYARPEKREPVYLAKAENKTHVPSAAQTSKQQFEQTATDKEDLIPIIEDEAISDEWIAENSQCVMTICRRVNGQTFDSVNPCAVFTQNRCDSRINVVCQTDDRSIKSVALCTQIRD